MENLIWNSKALVNEQFLLITFEVLFEPLSERKKWKICEISSELGGIDSKYFFLKFLDN